MEDGDEDEVDDGDEDENELVVDVVDDAEVDWLMSMRKWLRLRLRLRLICG